MNEIDTLREVILELHGCSSRHVSTVPVKETSQGHTVWQGLVEVFDLIDHPKAHRCYAWTYQNDEGRMQYAAVLGMPPVQSAHDAVKAAIADPLLTRQRTLSFLPNLRDAGYGEVGSGVDLEGRFCPNCWANIGPGTLDIIGCPFADTRESTMKSMMITTRTKKSGRTQSSHPASGPPQSSTSRHSEGLESRSLLPVKSARYAVKAAIAAAQVRNKRKKRT